ncbi:calcium-responsive transcription factor-like [Gigantopelta aegis]|uniref:calcium-responsive transcription factor-like n=1 Tax=Gigantopelta aegis TaxID=1735272 RepID=UPI001B88A8DE|nr:calcium-responsive transcription factor-like [Gigantopelta aegis]
MTKDGDVISNPDVVMGIVANHGGGAEGLMSIPISTCTLVSRDEHGNDVCGIGGTCSVANVHTLGGFKPETTALQCLLAAPISAPQIVGNPDAIQVITMPAPSDGIARIWQVIPNPDNPEIAALIAVNNAGEYVPKSDANETGPQFVHDNVPGGEMLSVTTEAGVMMPPPAPPQQMFPVDFPAWALKLKNCEKIGDSYRGYVENEVELDTLLTLHKQQTASFWGTRQSPSPAKPSTRLMWKSQYVPFDGMPFVNAGSRAVVQECQYGPRRKGNPYKKTVEDNSKVYRQTCPARIYIKKVKKFPDYAVDVNVDKRTLKGAMDKAFQELKERGIPDGYGEERFYIQLPTEKAHEFHDEQATPAAAPPKYTPNSEVEKEEIDASSRRLHPQVVQKIRDLVSGGETRVYHIRRQLRMFVMRDVCHGNIPERHDLTLFPTINDLKNHIHQALRDIENGTLPLTASTVNVEIITTPDKNGPSVSNVEFNQVNPAMWVGMPIAQEGPVPETVTVTLTQNPGEDGHHIVSRIETHLSDGTTQVSTTLTPETAELLSRLHPGMFSASNLLQLTPTLTNLTPNIQQAGLPNNAQQIVVTDEMAGSSVPQVSEMETQPQDCNPLDTGPPLHIVDNSIVHSDSPDEQNNLAVSMATTEHELAQLDSSISEQDISLEG